MFGSGPFPFARPPRALRPCVRSPAGPPRPPPASHRTGSPRSPARRIPPARRVPADPPPLRAAVSRRAAFLSVFHYPLPAANAHNKWRRSMVKGPLERDRGFRISDGFRARVSHLRFCRDPSIGAPSAFFKESNVAVFCANHSLEDASKVSRTLLGGRAVCGVSASSSGSLPRAPAIVFRDACGSCPRSHRWRLGCPARHW